MDFLKDKLGDKFDEFKTLIGDTKIILDDGELVPKARLDEIVESNTALKTQLTERDSQLTDLTKLTGENNELKTKIEEFSTKNKQTVEDLEKQLAERELNHNVELALRDAGAKNTKAVKALLDLNKVSIKDGKLEGISEQLETVKKDNDYLFGETVPAGAGREKPPASGAGEVTWGTAIEEALNKKI